MQQIICTKCWSKVFSFHEFYQQVKYKHDELADEKFEVINDSKDGEADDTPTIKIEPHTHITEQLYESDITVNPINVDEDVEGDDENYNYDNDVKQNDSSSETDECKHVKF